MNILEKLRKETKNLDLNYYGIEDMSTGIKIKDLLHNQNIILEHFNFVKIESINNYIDYLFIDVLLKFEETIPYIKGNQQKEFKTFISKCKQIHNKYNHKIILPFLKKNYIYIYEYSDSEHRKEDIIYLEYDIKTYTSNIIGANFNSFENEIINYIIDNQIYNIVDNFNIWKKYFSKNPNMLEYLFSKNNIEILLNTRLSDILEIILSFNSNKNFKDSLERISSLIFKCSKDKYSNDPQNIIQNYYDLYELTTFFQKLKSPHAYELEKLYVKQEELLEDHVINKGHIFSYKIEPDELQIFLNDDSTSFTQKIMSLTHYLDDSGKYISLLEKGANSNNPIVSDFIVRKNPNEDEFFTRTRLRNIEIQTKYIQSVLAQLLNEENNINDFMTYLAQSLHKICIQIDTTLELEKFDNDLEMLGQLLMDLLINFNSDFSEITIKNNIFSSAVLLCGLIEKTLRLIYKFWIRNETYIPDSKLTLTPLLNYTQNSIILDILGFEQTIILRYFLTKTDEGIGLNIRNNLTHINGNTIKRLNYNLLFELLYYYVTIVNSALLFYSKE